MIRVFHNGKIYVEKGQFCQALSVQDGIIQRIGGDDEILAHGADEIIDLQGAAVVPGFNDSHLHLGMVGENMRTCDLRGARSVQEIVERGMAFLERFPETPILIGKGWNQNEFEGEHRMPDRWDLDRISTSIPVIFDRVCIHVAAANTRALELLGIDADTRIEGGQILRAENGSATGIFTENGVGFLHSIIPEKTSRDLAEDLLRAADLALSRGITSVQSCDVLMSRNPQAVFETVGDLVSTGRLKLRYGHQFNFRDPETFRDYLAGERLNPIYDERVYSKGALKLFKDGSLGGRTARLSRDYSDAPGERGVEAMTDEDLMKWCRLAADHGVRVITHAIGDDAVQSVIDAYSKVLEGGENRLRHGIVHAQITSAEQLRDLARLKIPVMVQPIFLESDLPIITDRVGDLAASSYAFHSLVSLGAPVSLSTDSPVESLDPFANIFSAMMRTRLDGTPEGGFFPEERMGLEEALDAYTIGSAWNEGKELFKGRLKPGFAADMAVLDGDLFTMDPARIPEVSVIRTIVDGVTVYSAKTADQERDHAAKKTVQQTQTGE